jgi:hypothetical protein
MSKHSGQSRRSPRIAVAGVAALAVAAAAAAFPAAGSAATVTPYAGHYVCTGDLVAALHTTGLTANQWSGTYGLTGGLDCVSAKGSESPAVSGSGTFVSKNQRTVPEPGCGAFVMAYNHHLSGVALMTLDGKAYHLSTEISDAGDAAVVSGSGVSADGTTISVAGGGPTTYRDVCPNTVLATAVVLSVDVLKP